MWIDDYQRWLSVEESLQNAQLVINHFSNTEWVKESLSAMLGNMRHESSVNPNMYEYGYDWNEDRGFGLVQWTPRSKYWDWAVANNLPPESGNSQLARIDYEVDNNIQWIAKESVFNGLTFKEFRTNSRGLTVDQLTEAFTWGYERPNQQAGEESMPDRKAFANRVFNELDFSGTGSGGGGKPYFPTSPESIVTSPYGWRTHPITGLLTFHAGTDFASPNGGSQPVYATQSGVVTVNTWSDSGGWMIYIKHSGDPYHSRYLHLNSQSPISVGTTVTKGQEIGMTGNTGASDGVHLHFEVATSESGFGTENGTIDPEIYLEMSFGGGGESGKLESDLIQLLLCDALNGWNY